MAADVALFFLLFAGPSSVLAVLSARDFHLRGLPPDPARLRRAGILLGLAGVVAALLGAAVAVAAGPGALLAPRGGPVLGYASAQLLLGIVGPWLQRRAAADARRKLVKAAETVPFAMVMLSVSLVVAAWRAP